MKNKRGQNRQAGAPAIPGAGRKPQSLTVKLGDGVAVKYASDGGSTAFELGEVVSIHRGRPRTAEIKLRSGMTLWMLVETPKDD